MTHSEARSSSGAPELNDHNIHAEKILILDFGSQYTQLIARRVREVGVYCEIRPYDVSTELVDDFNPSGVILSGGPESVTRDDTFRAPDHIFEKEIPVLGICYGMQTMAMQLGGHVEGSDEQEFGYARVNITSDGELLRGIEDGKNDGCSFLDVWMSHGDKVVELPPGLI